ncbi:hypothetical protein CRD60_01945 [Bifidobacterium aemilianum]|uniref:DUF4391 domain-containing protein n=1 Tax=Bifidobacterium aemilianum TaxID=2493120 RepID=A0A366KAK5_9BIFI|nr:DUF4391 domain-containing protein [Bifidobacterium aemilianum]RBP98629.1 hypothetical protein CRD60_01945 [Bifidobacterium aemilianum]
MTPSSCGPISALTLGLPASTVLPADKGTLPKQVFMAKGPLSAKLKQRFSKDIESISMLALLRPANTGLAEGKRVKEILVIGLELNCQEFPSEIVDHIAGMRPSGILFLCLRKGTAPDQASTPNYEAALAVRRALPGRAGHEQRLKVFAGDWQPAQAISVQVFGSDMDEAWESLSSQAILGQPDSKDLDQRIAARDQIKALHLEEEKLTKDHARAKNPTQRNEIFAKLHKLRAQLAQLEG